MTPELATELIKAMMLEAVALATPVILTAMVIGLAISLFQAVTSINEQTLTFAPKAIGVGAVVIVLLPWMARTLIEYTTAVIERIPDMVR